MKQVLFKDKEYLFSLSVQVLSLLLLFSLYKEIYFLFGTKAMEIYAISRRDVVFLHSIMSMGFYYSAFYLTIQCSSQKERYSILILSIILVSLANLLWLFFFWNSILEKIQIKQGLNLFIMLYILGTTYTFSLFNILYYFLRANRYWKRSSIYELLIKGLLPSITVYVGWLLKCNFEETLIISLIVQFFFVTLSYLMLLARFKYRRISFKNGATLLQKIILFSIQRVPFDIGINIFLFIPTLADLSTVGIIAILMSLFSAFNYAFSTLSLIYVPRIFSHYNEKRINKDILKLLSLSVFLAGLLVTMFFLSSKIFLSHLGIQLTNYKQLLLQFSLSSFFLFLFTVGRYVVDSLSSWGYNSITIWFSIIVYLLLGQISGNNDMWSFVFSSFTLFASTWIYIAVKQRLCYESRK